MIKTRKPARKQWTLDVDAAPLRLGAECGLFIDVQPDRAVAAGDWIATKAGSRYLVLRAQPSRARRHAQQTRYQLRVARLPKHTEPPADVRTWWMTWYPRARKAASQ